MRWLTTNKHWLLVNCEFKNSKEIKKILINLSWRQLKEVVSWQFTMKPSNHVSINPMQPQALPTHLKISPYKPPQLRSICISFILLLFYRRREEKAKAIRKHYLIEKKKNSSKNKESRGKLEKRLLKINCFRMQRVWKSAAAARPHLEWARWDFPILSRLSTSAEKSEKISNFVETFF